jgi:predicted ATPase
MITRLQVKNYKCFDYIDVHLKPFMLLVGPNGSGKSTFLDVFSFISDILKDLQKAIDKRALGNFKDLLWNKEEEMISFVFEIEIPDEINQDFKYARYEISIKYEELYGVYIKNENLYLFPDEVDIKTVQKNNNEGIFLFDPNEVTYDGFEFLTSKKPFKQIFRRLGSIIHHNIEPGTTEGGGGTIPLSLSSLNPSYWGIENMQKNKPISYWLHNIFSQNFNYLQIQSPLMKVPCPYYKSAILEQDGLNLPKVIEQLEKNNKKNFNDWIEHLRTALPDFENLKTLLREFEGTLYLQAIFKNNKKIPQWHLSDGTLRLLALTLLPYLEEKDKLYMIEEPENGLHPQAIETIIDSLRSCYDSQVLLASHSPNILALMKPDDILCFSKSESGAVNVIEGENHPRIKKWKGHVHLPTLHASGVLEL